MIIASYALKDIAVFVLSEEDNMARIMEKGKIIWFTVKAEIPSVPGFPKTK